MKTTTREQEALDTLHEFLKPGDKVYTKVTHVARSGMSRSIDVYIMRDGEPWNITHLVCRALDRRFDESNGGVRVSGCGMDMGFEVVYNLGRRMFANGTPCAGEKCQSNDHSNGDRNYKPHHHTDGGYTFRQVWL